MLKSHICLTLLLLLLSITSGCGDEDVVAPPAPDTSDKTAPTAVTDLAVPSSTSSTVTLTWSAPGDDRMVGTAELYDLRYSTSMVSESNFNSCAQAVDVPTPSAPGTGETFVVTDLEENETYYFALKTADEVPNWSAISNVTNAGTPDITAPMDVLDLAAPSSTDSSVTLTWTAPGDDGKVGTATQYDIRYSTAPINDANFESAAQAADIPAPSETKTMETFTVTGLSESATYHFALKTADEAANWSGLSNVTSASTPPRYRTEWGSLGTGDGQFSYPAGAAVDGSGNVYVADRGNDRVQKFDSSGEVRGH